MPQKHGLSSFQDDWLDRKLNPDLFWVQRAKSKLDATCRFCKKTFDVSNMGKPSLVSHAKGKKHNKLVEIFRKQKKVKFFETRDEQGDGVNSNAQRCSPKETPVRGPVSPSTSGSSHPITEYVNKEDVIDAEIYWALDHVSNKSSVRSACKSSDLFPKMFKDSQIAQKFQMQKDKLSYSITYGLGPYFRNELVEFLRLLDVFNVAFDESLNKIAQKGQMDIMIRYFIGDQVHTRYFSSTFLGHAKSVDLLKGFTAEFERHRIDLELMTQLSMDGPNVNKKFRRELCEILSRSDDSPKLIDIGTCILHIVNNCYRKGHSEVDWKINEFLRALYYLFKDFPTRRADFIHFTLTKLFALKFCFIRWLENGKVMQRALAMIDPMKVYIEGVKKNPPESNNYHKIKEFLEDDFLKAKLSFMVSIDMQIQPFLVKYQTVKPMVPFLMNDLYDLLKRLMARVIKPKEMADIKCVKDLLSVDLNNGSLLQPLKMIDIGFAASHALENIKPQLTEKEILAFRLQCQKFILGICKKFQKDSSLSYEFVRGASCLSPFVMQNQSTAVNRLNIALKYLVRIYRLKAIEADEVKREYSIFLQSPRVQSALKHFSVDTDRLDSFLFKLLREAKVSDAFLKFVKLILCLYHGNASVERSFSFNKEFLVENLKEETLVALRNVDDAIRFIGGVDKIDITSKMRKAFLGAHKNRKMVLDQKSESEKKDKEMKRRAADEIRCLELKKRRICEEQNEKLQLLDEQLREWQKLSGV
ncbi:hypothetical protein QAD02_014195 [Eretmocerus hayati]|uniref:Uncharacterized protein n=2 Tax=Eretmocerus hayati TaxID=131215 RepID=A0ACC2P304_9HYME|nr:hypothetical protein QAD02_013751 [Eretmocerus hayati]KAJ8678408.1 hypothetical protein QAD02_014195 [Eretmocerus hayati]